MHIIIRNRRTMIHENVYLPFAKLSDAQCLKEYYSERGFDIMELKSETMSL